MDAPVARPSSTRTTVRPWTWAAGRQTWSEFREEADEVVCAATPRTLGAVGLWYEDFRQVTDEDVRHLLEQAAHHTLAEAAGAGVAHAASQR